MADALWSGGGPTVNSGGTNPVYQSPLPAVATGSATRTDTELTIRHSGRFSRAGLRISSTSGVAGTVLLYVNGSATAFGFASIGTATGEFYDSGTADVVAGDEVCWRGLHGGIGNFVVSRLQAVFTPSDGTCVVYVGGTRSGSFSTDSTTQYMGFSRTTALEATEANAEQQVQFPATLRNFSFRVSANARSTNTVLTVRVNNADTSLTATVGAGATGVFEDSSNSATVAAGGKFALAITTSTGGGAFSWGSGHVCAIAVVGGYQHYRSGALNTMVVNAGVTTYSQFSNCNVPNTTESSFRLDHEVTHDADKLSVYASANATTSASTVKLRVNGADSVLSVSIGAGATGGFHDTTHILTLTPDDEVTLGIVNGGGGTITLRHIVMRGLQRQGRTVQANQSVRRAAFF